MRLPVTFCKTGRRMNCLLSKGPHSLRNLWLKLYLLFGISVLCCIEIKFAVSRATSLPKICGMVSPRWRLAFWRAASTRFAASSLWASVMLEQRCCSPAVLLATHARCNVAFVSLLATHSQQEARGFSALCAQVIAENIKNGGDLNAMLPGQKVCRLAFPH